MSKQLVMRAPEWVDGGEYAMTTAGRIFYRQEGVGPTLLMLHGFPTWSYDWAQVTPELARGYRVVTLDFPGYGFSDKHNGVNFSVNGAADAVEQVLKHLGISRTSLVLHNFGGIVGQELLDRRLQRRLSFAIEALHILNNGIVHGAYRPTRAQKLLAIPVLGNLAAKLLTKRRLLVALNAVRGIDKLDADDFNQLWLGMARDEGYKLAHKHIRYNAERRAHHDRWERAFFGFDGPTQLIWGLADPVSGRNVLEVARPMLPKAQITTLEDVGHFPQSEAPAQVIAAIRGGV